MVGVNYLFCIFYAVGCYKGDTVLLKFLKSVFFVNSPSTKLQAGILAFFDYIAFKVFIFITVEINAAVFDTFCVLNIIFADF